jgi:DNA-directed RNA polymerase subunit beta'
MKVPKEKEDLLKTGDAKANEVLKYFYKGFLSEEEKHRLVVKIWTEVKKDVEKDLKSIIGAGNDLYTMIDS